MGRDPHDWDLATDASPDEVSGEVTLVNKPKSEMTEEEKEKELV